MNIVILRCDTRVKNDVAEREREVINSYNQKVRTKPFNRDSQPRKINENSKKLFKSQRKKYQCELCCWVFLRKARLEDHKNTHSGEKPYICQHCEKAFSGRDVLRQHLKIHQDKKFVCEICQKDFTQKSSLNHHFIIHTQEKPFSCQICGTSFNRKFDLSRHKRTHSGDRPFRCHVCGNAFTLKSQLNQHLNQKHIEQR